MLGCGRSPAGLTMEASTHSSVSTSWSWAPVTHGLAVDNTYKVIIHLLVLKKAETQIESNILLSCRRCAAAATRGQSCRPTAR